MKPNIKIYAYCVILLFIGTATVYICVYHLYWHYFFFERKNNIISNMDRSTLTNSMVHDKENYFKYTTFRLPVFQDSICVEDSVRFSKARYNNGKGFKCANKAGKKVLYQIYDAASHNGYDSCNETILLNQSRLSWLFTEQGRNYLSIKAVEDATSKSGIEYQTLRESNYMIVLARKKAMKINSDINWYDVDICSSKYHVRVSLYGKDVENVYEITNSLIKENESNWE